MGCLQGIVFDLDDTLIGSTAAMQAAIEATLPYLPSIGASELGTALAQAYQALWGYGTSGYASLKTLPTPQLRDTLTRAVLERLELATPVSPKTIMAHYAAAEEAALAPLPGARELLTALKPHFALGIITNGPSQIQREKLERVGLSGYFDVVVADADIGVPKPAPEIFTYTARLLGLTNGELLFAGDSVEADIRGANTAGWRSVYVGMGTCPEATFSLRGLEELLTLPPVLEVKRLAFKRKVADTRD